MLTNITMQTVQSGNRFLPQQYPNPACFPQAAMPAGVYGADCQGSLRPEAFTPYAPASAIRRNSNIVGNTATLMTQSTSRVDVPYSYSTNQVTLSRPHASSLAAAPTAPVYGPSTASPYQLFVDVVTGASLSIDVDDDRLLQNGGYAAANQYPRQAATQPSMPSAISYDGSVMSVGSYDTSMTSAPCPCIYCVATTATHDLSSVHAAMPHEGMTMASFPAPMPTDECHTQPQTQSQPQPQPQQEAATPAKTTEEATPARQRRSKPAALSAEATTPSSFNRDTPSRDSSKKAQSMSPTAQIFGVTVIGHHGRTQRVVSHIPLVTGAHVVFEGDRGIDMGIVESAAPTSGKIAPGSSMVVRNATKEEINLWMEELPQMAEEAVGDCNALIESMQLRMTVRQASYQLDKQKLTFFFESPDSRVDFRKLCVELFNRYRCRIWMEKYSK